MTNWLESVEIAERKKARERTKLLNKWNDVSEIFMQLQNKYNADGLFNFNFRMMSDADALLWCKCAIFFTDIVTIEKLMFEHEKIVHCNNGKFYILKSDNHGNMYHIEEA